MPNQVEKLKNAEQTWRKHAENCGQKCLSTLILIYFPFHGTQICKLVESPAFGQVFVGLWTLHSHAFSPYLCLCLLEAQSLLLGAHFDQNKSPGHCRLVGLVSHDVSRRGSKRLPVTNGVLNHMPHRHYLALSVVSWPPVRPSTKAGLVAPGDALQKHQFPLQAAKGWFADKPTVKKDAKDIKRLLCWRG